MTANVCRRAELWVQQCNGLFPAGSDSLDAISCCAGSLRALHLMDLHSHVSGLALAGLSSLTRVRLLRSRKLFLVNFGPLKPRESRGK